MCTMRFSWKRFLDTSISKQKRRIDAYLATHQDESQNLETCWDRDGRKCCTECSSTLRRSAGRAETAPTRRTRTERRRTPWQSRTAQRATSHITTIFIYVFIYYWIIHTKYRHTYRLHTHICKVNVCMMFRCRNIANELLTALNF